MLLFVLLLPPEFAPGVPLPPGVDREEFARLERDAQALLTDYVQARPKAGSAEEEQLHRRYLELLASASSVLRLSFITVSRHSIMAALQSLVDKELATVDGKRKFALRLLAQATESAGVLFERVGLVLEQLGPAVVDRALADAVRSLVGGELAIEPQDRVVLRFALDLSVAMQSLERPLDELTSWALRAALGGRRTLALLPAFDALELRGELVRHRVKGAWLKWKASDVDEELAPWTRSASP